MTSDTEEAVARVEESLPEPLSSHARFITAALSYYDDKPAEQDVLLAWHTILTALERAEAEIARRDAVSKASWGDQKDEHTDAIHAAHPTNTKDFETYDTALAMIGARHGKYELVNLVNWLLVRAQRAEREMDANAAKAADWQAMRDERDAMIGNYHNLYRDTEGDIAMANLRAQSAEAALAAIKAEVVEVVGPFAEAAENAEPVDFDTDNLWETPEAMMLTYGDLRAARDLLAKLKGETP